MKLRTKIVERNTQPMIVAEMSSNHKQSFERALKIVEVAADAGVDAIKIQTYRPDTITMDVSSERFTIKDRGNPWFGRRLHELYSTSYTPWEWIGPIFDVAKRSGILAFSTPFDESAVNHLEEHDPPCYKIASFEITHLPLIRKVAATGKPIILSTGMALVEEIREAIEVFRQTSDSEIILMKCTSAYPAPPEEANILTIPHMRKTFGCEIGLSDHTLGIGTAIAAVSHGAVVIEKHFTLSRSDGGEDSAFSIEPNELRALVTESKRAWLSLGEPKYGPSPSEYSMQKLRQSLFAAHDIQKGTVVTRCNIKIARPGDGLDPKHFDSIIGRLVKNDIAKGTPLAWEVFE